MNYDFVRNTDWSRVFLNSRQLKKFVEVLSSSQAWEPLWGLLNHPLLDKESFNILFEKMKSEKVFIPEELSNQNKFDRESLNELGIRYQMTFDVFTSPYCSKSLLVSYATMSPHFKCSFLAQSRHDNLMDFYEILQDHCNDEEEKMLTLAFLENPRCPKEFIEKHFHENDAFFAKSLANPNCPQEVLYKGLERVKESSSSFYMFSKFLLNNKSLPSDIVDYIAERGWKVLEGNPLLHSNVSESTLLSIVKNIKYQLDEMEKGGNKNDLYGDGGERFALKRILSDVLEMKKLPESFLDECFERFPFEVIGNPNFKNWEELQKRIISFDDIEKIKVKNIILRRNDIPHKIFHDFLKVFEFNDMNTFCAIAKHPNCSKHFIEDNIQKLKKYGGEDDFRLKDFLKNYSLNPTLSTKEMLKFFLEYDNPFLLFENPAFGRLPDPIKDMMIDRVVSPIKERESVLVDFLM